MPNTYAYVLETMIFLTPTHLQLVASPKTSPMQYKAGQYLFLKYSNGKSMPFSIANAPQPNHKIELHIRVASDDSETQEFIQEVQKSKQLILEGPMGECGYHKKSGPILLLSAGTGFAPAKAIIEYLIKQEPDKVCYLYWTVKQPSDFYLPDLPKTWQKDLPNFYFRPICTRVDFKGNKNSILEAVLSDFSDLAGCQVYVFGPGTLVTDALNKFQPFGLKQENFFTDVG